MNASTEALLALLFPLMGLLVVTRLTIGRSLTVFSGRRALMSMRTLTGPNLSAVLAVLSVAALVLDGRLIVGASQNTSVSSLFVVLALVAVALVALGGSMGLALVAIAGIGAQLLFITIEHGPNAALALTLLSVLMLVALGFMRGFAR